MDLWDLLDDFFDLLERVGILKILDPSNKLGRGSSHTTKNRVPLTKVPRQNFVFSILKVGGKGIKYDQIQNILPLKCDKIQGTKHDEIQD